MSDHSFEKVSHRRYYGIEIWGQIYPSNQFLSWIIEVLTIDAVILFSDVIIAWPSHGLVILDGDIFFGGFALSEFSALPGHLVKEEIFITIFRLRSLRGQWNEGY